MKPLAHHMEQAGLTVKQLANSTGLDRNLVKSIVNGNYISSPAQRQLIASVVGVDQDAISWRHAVPVEFMRGNGPQSGRPT